MSRSEDFANNALSISPAYDTARSMGELVTGLRNIKRAPVRAARPSRLVEWFLRMKGK